MYNSLLKFVVNDWICLIGQSFIFMRFFRQKIDLDKSPQVTVHSPFDSHHSGTLNSSHLNQKGSYDFFSWGFPCLEKI